MGISTFLLWRENKVRYADISRNEVEMKNSMTS